MKAAALADAPCIRAKSEAFTRIACKNGLYRLDAAATPPQVLADFALERAHKADM